MDTDKFSRRNFQIVFSFILLSFACISHAELANIIRNIKPSIVGVGSYNPLATPRAQLKGTGFSVKNGQYVATNYHVVAPIQIMDDASIVVLVGTGLKAKAYEAVLVSQQETFDLAILKINGPKIPALKISERSWTEGEEIAFTGFPIGSVLGLYPVTHRGIISSVTPIAVPAGSSKDLNANVIRRLRKPYFVYQLDATAYPGNSGSPLYDRSTGEVAGVINKVFVKQSKEAVLSDPSGITYAIPAIYLMEMLKELP